MPLQDEQWHMQRVACPEPLSVLDPVLINDVFFSQSVI